MSKIEITSAAVKKIQKKVQGPAKLLLSYNDGVGPYSKVGSCTVGTDFDIIVVDKNQNTPDYQAKLDSPLGPVYYKGYSKEYMEAHPKLDVDPSFGQMTLSGDGGLVDGSVEIIDYRKKK